MIVHSPAVVLKRVPFGESSLVVRCFTQEKGKLGLLVKGARRKKNPLVAYFQPANYLDLVFYYKPTRDLQTVSKVNFNRQWTQTHNDLKRITYMLAVIELTDKTLAQEDTHTDLFQELVQVLTVMDAQWERLNLIFWYYELSLLTLLGYKPDFKKRDFPGLMFPNPEQGPHSGEILETLLKGSLQEPEFFQTLQSLRITPRDRKIVSDYINTHLQYHFEGLGELKSLKVLREVLT